MTAPSQSRKWTATFMAIALLGSSTAHAAAPARIDPLVALSVFGTAESRAAVCAAGASAAASAAGAAVAAQGAGPGCVLPVVDAPPPPAMSEAAPPPPLEAAPVVASGAGILPLLAGLAAIVGFAALVLDGNETNGEIVLPISP